MKVIWELRYCSTYQVAAVIKNYAAAVLGTMAGVSNTDNTKDSTTRLNCRTNRPGNKNDRCEGSSHQGKHRDSCQRKPNSAIFFEFAIVTRRLLAIEPIVAKLLRPGRKLNIPRVLPERAHLPP
jgi:hypothetical protein